MNIKEIDKWLDEEYGCSYTRLEELFNFEIDKQLKLFDKVEQLEKENKKYKEVIDKAIEYIETHKRKDEFLELNEWQTRDLLDILKGVSK